MAGPTPSWNTVPLFGTWRNFDGTLKAGAYKVTSAVRVTNRTDDVIVPAGLVASGTLIEKEATGGAQTHSLYLDVPASDDPDNDVRGWQLTVEVTFKDSPGEKYILDTPLSALNNTPAGINLRKVLLPQTIPVPASVLIRGVPGGLAEYDADGDVVDAAGNKVTGGTGGTGGPVTSGSITDASTIGKAVLRATTAPIALGLLGGAATSDLASYALKADLNAYATTGQLTGKVDTSTKGKPGGVAALDADGDVIDASGVKVKSSVSTGGTGGTSTTLDVLYSGGAYPSQGVDAPPGVRVRHFYGPVQYAGPSWSGVLDLYTYAALT